MAKRPDSPRTGLTATDVVARARLLPVLSVEETGSAHRLGRALADGGLPLVEVVFRTPDAAAALEAMAADEQMCVGAGTVLSPAQVDRSVDAGARFVVSPGLSAAVVRRCQELSVPVFPGVATASELMEALELGVEVVKLFPAEQLGGPAMVSALAAPFPQARFIPTGGVTQANAGDYLQHRSVVAVGGSWMAPTALVREKDWRRVTELTRAAVTEHVKEEAR